MVDVVEAAFDVGVQNPLTTSSLAEDAAVQCGDRVHRSAARTEAVGVRFEAALPFRFQGQLHEGLHHPVLHGRNPERAAFAPGLRDIDAPPRRLRPVAFEPKPTRELQAGSGRVADYAARVPAASLPQVLLGDLPDRQQLPRM